MSFRGKSCGGGANSREYVSRKSRALNGYCYCGIVVRRRLSEMRCIQGLRRSDCSIDTGCRWDGNSIVVDCNDSAF